METASSVQTAVFSPRCGANKSNGEQCKNPAGYGTTHPGYGKCKWHYGNTPAMRTNGARLMIRGEANKLCEERGINPDDVTPERVMMEELARSYAIVNYLESQTDTAAAMWPDWQAVMLNERKHMASIAKMMIDAGIAERHVRMVEGQAQVLGLAIRAILDRLQLTDVQRSMAPTVVREVMAELPAAS